ncbi:M61 family metallopeptidase [Idiomarina xiamenensis]|uniref:Aminopeptidase n=1 Tax=Idiomarina xiamenensis 10-D-4 TaxID=740709 RepID=K2KGC2_9GAMM|nr:PDZ domain-containing protein [Idiomarina xiamenensis]EKE87048.1 aminopeptidase [Idiomarina xiamenensis 10-D-4]
MITYQITPADLHGHLFSVSISIDADSADGQRLSLPNWIPGSYMIRDFAKHIIGFYAEDVNGDEVAWRWLNKHQIQLAASNTPISVHYQVYAWDLSVRSAYLDQYQGFFNNSSLCFAVVGQTEQPCELQLHAPSQQPHWQVATGMPRVSGSAFGFGRFRADNYEALIDYPFLLGELTIQDFIAHGIKHQLVLSGKQQADMGRITADLAKICEQQLALFGEPAPFTSYTFLTLVVGSGFGGLEHRNSTALICSRKDLLGGRKDGRLNNDYRTFLSLCSHEYFHSWNVKTLKPKRFLPYQLDSEQYTEQLWFYEGMTSYFDDYILHKAGLIDANQYLQLVGETLSRVRRGAGSSSQTVTESSFLSWTKFYQQNENAANSIVSYYAKGGLIALCLDLTLRLQSDHQLSLLQVMRDLWHAYGKTAIGTDDDTLIKHLQSYPGIDVDALLQKALYSTDPLPLSELLDNFGVRVHKQVAADDNTLNGKASDSPAHVSLGAKYKVHSQGLDVQVVYHDEAAYHAGLASGDRIVAIDHIQVNEPNLKEILQAAQAHRETTVHAFRRDQLLTLKLIWQAPKSNNHVLSINRPERLQGWLNYPI